MCTDTCFQLPEDTSIHHFVTELIEETKRFEETKKVRYGREEDKFNVSVVTGAVASFPGTRYGTRLLEQVLSMWCKLERTICNLDECIHAEQN